MNLLIFFALPLATILLSIVLQKILKSPTLVAITFFAIYLIVAFVSFSDTLAEAIIAVLVYTIIAYITAYIVMIICRCKRRFCTSLSHSTCEERRCRCGNNNENNNLLRISCSCGNGTQSSDLLSVDSTCMENRNDDINEEENIETSNLNTQNQYLNSASMYASQNNVQRRICRR